MKFTINKSILASIVLLTVTVFVIILISVRQSEKLKDIRQSIESEEAVSSLLQQLTSAVLDNETGARGYVIAGTDNFLEPLLRSEKLMNRLMIQLNRKITDPEVLKILNDSINPLLIKRAAFSWSMVSLRRQNKSEESIDLVKKGLGKYYTDEIRRLSDKVSGIHYKKLAQRRNTNEELILRLNHYLYITLGLVLLFFLFNFLQIIRFFRKQKIVQEHLKQNEEIFSTLFYKSPVMKWIMNEETRKISVVNDAICEFFGFSKEEMTGKTADKIGVLVPPEIREALNTQLQLIGKLRNIEVNTRNKKGEEKWISIDVDPINLYGTKSLIAAMIDITERKQNELHIVKLNEELEGKVLLKTKEIRESQEKLKILNEELEQKVHERTLQLEKSNRELEAFSYSVSHDLRAPLRSINGFATIMEEDYAGKMDTEEKRLLSVIKNNTQKMGNLIDDLLAFSRMGRKGIIKSEIDTQKMVNDVIHDQAPQVTTKISWMIHTLPSCWGDANTMQQVWVNLISNAIKYSRKKEIPEIEIGSFRKEGQTVFYVKDNGVGFDEKYSNKLFRVFQRLHSESEFEGTGVGLALADKIISKHGGQVWATSEPDKGACFYFSIPPQ